MIKKSAEQKWNKADVSIDTVWNDPTADAIDTIWNYPTADAIDTVWNVPPADTIDAVWNDPPADAFYLIWSWMDHKQLDKDNIFIGPLLAVIFSNKIKFHKINNNIFWL